MKKSNGMAEDLKIAYIGGGSRGWARGMMSDLLSEDNISGTVYLYDIDKKAAEDNAVIGARLAALPDAKSKWSFIAEPDMDKALDGADFVVISILPGTFEEMRSDVHTPEKYGIYQSVGDTVGPAGLLRALRTLPMYKEFAEGIARRCPDAWVINYTNPNTLCVRTLYEVFPKIKAFGCCHEVFSAQKLLCEALADIKGIEGVEREQIYTNVLGINHFSWIDKASYGSLDLVPVYAEFVEKYWQTGYNREHRLKFDLFRRYGVIAASGDRHLAEFCPSWYLSTPETASRYTFGLTPVSERIEGEERRRHKTEMIFSGEKELKIHRTGEEGTRQMKCLLGLEGMTTNVNIPNIGQVNNLPLGAVVETNAVFSENSVIPIVAGGLPDEVNILVLRHVVNQENTLKAALTRDKRLALNVLLNDPLVRLDIDDSRALLDEMMYNTRKYLPGWDIQEPKAE